ncbi:putative BAS1-transcription factor [Fusarium sp. NRRL 25303]|nr:putative BAS1-transcription factor [Fusarium sp. NRRL 25303]
MSGQETSPQSPPANTPKHRRPWTAAEDATLRTLVGHFGASRGSEGRWKDIASGLEGRTAKDCRKRWLHSLDPSLRKGRWTSQEDEILLSAYARLGPLWNEIALLIPGRKDDQCSKRYNDILNPSAKNRLSDWTAEEDNLLRQGVAALGHRWVAISSRIPGRPPLTCRNRWRTLSRLSHNRQSRSQGTTPSSSSQMSPFDNGISPAAHNPNLGIETNHGVTTDLMHFPMDADMGHDQMGSSFLDSAFFDTFTGPSPSPLRESDPSDETETPNDVSVPGAASENTAPVPDLSSNIATQTQSDPKPWPQPPKPPQAQQHQNAPSASLIPSPSTWSSLGTMLPPGTSPTDQNMWLGMTGNPPTPKNWTAPGPADPSNSLPQSFTEQFQVPAVPGVPASTQQTIHHHHHHHVHHHFHHYHHYPGNGDQWRQLEQQSEAEAMQAHLQNENGPQNPG